MIGHAPVKAEGEAVAYDPVAYVARARFKVFIDSLQAKGDRTYQRPRWVGIGWRYDDTWFLTRRGAFKDYREDAAEAYFERYSQDPAPWLLETLN